MKIIYTYTDEAPALATHSFLPIIEAYAGVCGVEVETRDISLAARILATFNDLLPEDMRVNDALAELGALAKTPEANIIKLPNISASIPQLKAAIKELQDDGYPLPDYPEDPSTDEEKDALSRYSRVKGSAVNPVLREGNSDRRAPAAVKAFARNNPHSMGAWSADSKTDVATMDDGDFFHTEKSVTVDEPTDVRIEHVAADGAVTVLKASTPLLAGEIIDGSVMRKAALIDFLEAQIRRAKDEDVLFSLHMKATMMKVSDPIIFGHAVHVFFKDLFDQYGDDPAGASERDGMGAILGAAGDLSDDQRDALLATYQSCLDNGPDLAMVNSDKGITNLHVPSDVIIDASMPAMIRTSGQMWNADGEQQDTLAVIPDSSYAPLYAETIAHCKANGAFDPTTMGTVPNVGLMAQKAEEYGSHDKTFEVPSDGTVRVVDSSGTTLIEHAVAEGDIWRMCQAKDDPIRDWVKLAVTRARATGWPAVFWLDATRAHDAEVLKKVHAYLPEHDTDGLQIEVMNVADAARFSLERARNGENTISVTGNVLRDYLTDLFPILEVGTSAKMLSIVPLMAGGGLFETGAGGSAPKHVQQFVAEGHLRWDSLGEFLALAASLEHLSDSFGNPGAKVLGEALDKAVEELLQKAKSPSRKVNEIDNRGSQFYLAMFWAQAMAEQSDDPEMAAAFTPLAEALAASEATIAHDLIDCQGRPQDLGGYYWVDKQRVDGLMRPSTTFNDLLSTLGS